MPPIHVLLVANDDANPSPVTVLQSAESVVPEESPNVNAFQAPYQQTEDGVHLSIPVAPAPLSMASILTMIMMMVQTLMVK